MALPRLTRESPSEPKHDGLQAMAACSALEGLRCLSGEGSLAAQRLGTVFGDRPWADAIYAATRTLSSFDSISFSSGKRPVWSFEKSFLPLSSTSKMPPEPGIN